MRRPEWEGIPSIGKELTNNEITKKFLGATGLLALERVGKKRDQATVRGLAPECQQFGTSPTTDGSSRTEET